MRKTIKHNCLVPLESIMSNNIKAAIKKIKEYEGRFVRNISNIYIETNQDFIKKYCTEEDIECYYKSFINLVYIRFSCALEVEYDEEATESEIDKQIKKYINDNVDSEIKSIENIVKTYEAKPIFL